MAKKQDKVTSYFRQNDTSSDSDDDQPIMKRRREATKFLDSDDDDDDQQQSMHPQPSTSSSLAKASFVQEVVPPTPHYLSKYGYVEVIDDRVFNFMPKELRGKLSLLYSCY